MIINDLQYIESVDTSEIQGGHRFASSSARGEAQAYGDDTESYANTFVVADSDSGFSGALSESYASASTDDHD